MDRCCTGGTTKLSGTVVLAFCRIVCAAGAARVAVRATTAGAITGALPGDACERSQTMETAATLAASPAPASGCHQRDWSLLAAGWTPSADSGGSLESAALTRPATTPSRVTPRSARMTAPMTAYRPQRALR